MGLLPIQEDRVGHRLVAEKDVLGHRQDRNQHEVLVDHADPARDGVGRLADRDWAPVEQDLALVGRRQPVEDVHQRRLAGAVLAEERMDLARPNLQVDPVVGDDPGKRLVMPRISSAGAVTISVTAASGCG